MSESCMYMAVRAAADGNFVAILINLDVTRKNVTHKQLYLFAHAEYTWCIRLTALGGQILRSQATHAPTAITCGTQVICSIIQLLCLDQEARHQVQCRIGRTPAHCN